MVTVAEAEDPFGSSITVGAEPEKVNQAYNSAMKYRVVVALVFATLPWPALAQRGFDHGGSFGSRGGGQAGFSARPGFGARPSASARPVFPARPAFSQPRPIAPHDPSLGFNNSGRSPVFRPIAPHDPSLGFGNVRNSYTARPAYRAQFNGGSRVWNYSGNRDWDHDGDRGRHRDRDHDGDRDRFHRREGAFRDRYLYSYPASLGYIYPYYIGPGFYDGSGYDNSGYDQNNAASGYNDQGAGYQAENPNGAYGGPDGGGYGEPGEQPQPYPEPTEPQAVEPTPSSHFTVSGMDSASEYSIEGPITVIFKGGRAPAKMQNYMLTAKTLTDLDADHYEKIPLDQVDLAATAETNRANGVDFQVPGPAQY